MEHPIKVLIADGKHTWVTHAARVASSGLSERRYEELRGKFKDCDAIDKSRIIRSTADRLLFAGEVEQWLKEELDDDDRLKIYARQRLGYHPGYAMYCIMRYHKSRYTEKAKIAERRQNHAATAAAAEAATDEAAAASDTDADVDPSMNSNANEDHASPGLDADQNSDPPFDDDVPANVDASIDAGQTADPPFDHDVPANVDASNDAGQTADPPLDHDVPSNVANNTSFDLDQNSNDDEDFIINDSENTHENTDGELDISPNNENQAEVIAGPEVTADKVIADLEVIADPGVTADEVTAEPDIYDIVDPNATADAEGNAEAEIDAEDNTSMNLNDADHRNSNADPRNSHADPRNSNTDGNPAIDLSADDSPPFARKRRHSPDISSDLKRIKLPTLGFIHQQVDLLMQQAIELSGQVVETKMHEQYAKLRALSNIDQEMGEAGGIPVRKSADAERTASRFINYHIRIRGALDDQARQAVDREILDRGISFQNIWGFEAKNSDIALPLKNKVAANIPVFLVAAGYNAGGKTYTLFSPNQEDPPVLEVLLNQALINQGLDIIVYTMLRSKAMRENYRISEHKDIELFLQKLQIPEVADDNGINKTSSRRHILINITVGQKQLISVLDLCGDETHETRTGRLKDESTAIAADLAALRVLVTQHLNVHDLDIKTSIPGGGRGCYLTMAFVRQLPFCKKLDIAFFCDGSGSVTSIRKLCGEWRSAGGSIGGK